MPPAMAPSTLDLLVLTFNCAKTLVNPVVFANHLQTAFGANATCGLPDIVVLSLQEIAPLSPSFIGHYFLKPYIARFDQAINLAARQYCPLDTQREEAEERLASVTLTESGLSAKPPYSLVKAHNVGYTAILLFARDPKRVNNLQDAEVGFGAAEMGNKGAVGLRAIYDLNGDGKQATELTFVATHLAAMEWNLPKRNANWAAIMRGMTFGDPEVILEELKSTKSTPTPDDDSSGSGDERRRLLQDAHDAEHVRVRQRLHDISVFKPSSHLFVAGDLNYRISTSSPPPNASFPSLDPDSENYYPSFFALDQLTRERKAGRTMHGLSEHQVSFPPTYKYDVQPKQSPCMDEEEVSVPWKFAPHRYPSWTDRILYLDIPSWVSSPGIKVLSYDALPLLRSSDHRPVYFRAQVPLVPPKDMAPPASIQESESFADPRIRLPVEVDPEAWARRRAARQKELVTGWSAFLWSTKEGAWILATLVAVGWSAWWMFGKTAA